MSVHASVILGVSVCESERIRLCVSVHVCVSVRVHACAFVSERACVAAKAVHPSGSPPTSAAHLEKILEGRLA